MGVAEEAQVGRGDVAHAADADVEERLGIAHGRPAEEGFGGDAEDGGVGADAEGKAGDAVAAKAGLRRRPRAA